MLQQCCYTFIWIRIQKCLRLTYFFCFCIGSLKNVLYLRHIVPLIMLVFMLKGPPPPHICFIYTALYMYIWNTKNQEKLSCYFFWCRLHIAADDNGDLNHWKKKSLSWYILVFKTNAWFPCLLLIKYCYNNAEFQYFQSFICCVKCQWKSRGF